MPAKAKPAAAVVPLAAGTRLQARQHGRRSSTPPARSPNPFGLLADQCEGPEAATEEDESDNSHSDDPSLPAIGAHTTPLRPRAGSAPGSARPTEFYTPSRPPAPAPNQTTLPAEQALLAQSPVRTRNV